MSDPGKKIEIAIHWDETAVARSTGRLTLIEPGATDDSVVLTVCGIRYVDLDFKDRGVIEMTPPLFGKRT